MLCASVLQHELCIVEFVFVVYFYCLLLSHCGFFAANKEDYNSFTLKKLMRTEKEYSERRCDKLT